MKIYNFLQALKIVSNETNKQLIHNKDTQEKEKRLKKIYEVAIETRNFEISQLVQRNNFFMIFQGVLIACIINSNNTVPLIHTIICFVGIGISFYQMQAASGAKFWQEYWETEVNKAEGFLKDFYLSKNKDFHKLFNKNTHEVQRIVYKRIFDKKINKDSLFREQHYNNHPYKFIKTYNPFTSSKNRILTKPSVSKIPIQTGRFLLCIWLLILFFTTSYGEKIYIYFKDSGLVNGLPGKSITNIDIRNQKIPNRQDGFDDNDEIKAKNSIR